MSHLHTIGTGLLAFALAVLAPMGSSAWVRSTDPSTGVCLFWTRRALTWTVNEQGASQVDINDLESALQRSVAVWQDLDCSDIAFSYAGRTARIDIGYDPRSSDNVNLLVWRRRSCNAVVPFGDDCRDAETENPFACADKYGCWLHAAGVIALTTSSYNRRTGEVVDTDIEFNDTGVQRFTATRETTPICGRNTTNCVATDIQNTTTHEMGHFLGLAHSNVAGSTMFPSASVGETEKRDLAQDDIEGLCTLYPQQQAVQTCTRSGNISLSPTGPARPIGGCQSAPPNLAMLPLLALFSRAFRGRRR